MDELRYLKSVRRLSILLAVSLSSVGTKDTPQLFLFIVFTTLKVSALDYCVLNKEKAMC